MKKTLLYFIFIMPVLIFISCEKEIEVYQEPASNNRLNFVFESYGDTLISHTMVYYPEERVTDTLWIELKTSGYITDYPREVLLTQLPVDSNAAVAGVHYVAFDEPALKGSYVIPANQNNAKVPLIIKRDPSLKTKEYALKVGVKENEYFKQGFPATSERTIMISDIITQPQNWTGLVSWYCFGKYGKRKYQFMIEVGAKRGTIINEDFFKKLVPSNPPDMAYCNYWGGIFRDALEQENIAREKQGLGALREDPKAGETIGELIYFESYRDN